MGYKKDVTQYAAGSTEPWTVDILTAFIRALEPPRILELGTFEGLTTRRLAEEADNHGGHVVSVELDYERHQKAKKWLSGCDNVTLFLNDTKSFLHFYGGDKFNFAFVDDDHTASHVEQEIHLLRQIMEPGSYIFVHDVDGPFGLDMVVRAAGGYVLHLPKMHVAGGLGIIQT